MSSIFNGYLADSWKITKDFVINAGYDLSYWINNITDAIVESITSAPAEGQSGEYFGDIDPNKLKHIFGKDQHNLDNFLDAFDNNQEDAFNAVYSETEKYLQNNNITGQFKDIIVNVDGFNITVRGNIVGGVVRIGTFFIS